MFAKTFAAEVGQEEEPVRADRRIAGMPGDFGIGQLILMEGAARPAHRVAARVEQHEAAPERVDGRDVGDFGVQHRRVGKHGDDRRGARNVGAITVGDDARANH